MGRKKSSLVEEKNSVKTIIMRFIFLTLGAFIAAFALEVFLVPNQIIDGGIVGVSIMASHLTQIPLGVWIFILNIPFIFLALQKMGHRFVLRAFYSIMMLSVFVSVLHAKHVVADLLLATVFGGMILGLGVGLILRNDSALDGTEILSIRLAKKVGFSIGELIMFFNFFIFAAAGFLFGWNKAMYAILTYFIAYRVIDIVQTGLISSKAVRIISEKYKEIGDTLIERLDTTVTYVKAKGGYTGTEKVILYCVIPRIEMTKLRQLVKKIDPMAFLAVEEVHEVEGVQVRRKEEGKNKPKPKKK